MVIINHVSVQERQLYPRFSSRNGKIIVQEANFCLWSVLSCQIYTATDFTMPCFRGNPNLAV